MRATPTGKAVLMIKSRLAVILHQVRPFAAPGANPFGRMLVKGLSVQTGKQEFLS
ncbi:MAG: hypothetical protein JW943_00170 [Deltaproteobacteria bacterium]|nr:hypothetical protein [Deltaproteobacteria bacterium]